jgi:hypothetical protein
MASKWGKRAVISLGSCFAWAELFHGMWLSVWQFSWSPRLGEPKALPLLCEASKHCPGRGDGHELLSFVQSGVGVNRCAVTSDICGRRGAGCLGAVASDKARA